MESITTTPADRVYLLLRLGRRTRLIQDTGCVEWTGGHQADNRYGIIQVMRPSGRWGSALTHRLIWELTYGEIPAGKRVLHRCDRPLCINPEHLFVGDAATNSADMVAKSRQARGERQGLSKLKESQVLAMRAAFKNGMTVTQIANAFGTGYQNTRHVVHRHTWTHLP